MALPKQELAMFTLTVPSSKKKIKFRQFTVKEEKMLAQAEQSKDLDIIVNAIKGIIQLCCQDVGDVDSLALFDIEYIITRIRAKSVGEIIDLQLSCDKDKEHRKIPVIINLEQIEVQIPEGHSKKIPLYGDVGVVMKYPNLDIIKFLEKTDGDDEVGSIVECIDSIYTDEEIFYAKEQTKEELRDFVESLTNEQVEKINNTFFEKMPEYKHQIKYVCSDCGHEHTKTVKGIANFFA